MGVDDQKATLKMDVLEFIGYQISSLCLSHTQIHAHTLFIVCLIPELRHAYSEVVDFKLLGNFSVAQPFNAKLYVEGQCMRSFGAQSRDGGEVPLSPHSFSLPMHQQ